LELKLDLWIKNIHNFINKLCNLVGVLPLKFK